MAMENELYGGFLKWWYPPKHPKMIIFSRKIHGCWVPPFLETTIWTIWFLFEDVFPSEKREIQLLEFVVFKKSVVVFNIFLWFFFRIGGWKHHLLGKKCHPFQRSSYSLATKGSEKSLNQLLDETSNNILCIHFYLGNDDPRGGVLWEIPT